jgi:hypothetical protein
MKTYREWRNRYNDELGWMWKETVLASFEDNIRQRRLEKTTESLRIVRDPPEYNSEVT